MRENHDNTGEAMTTAYRRIVDEGGRCWEVWESRPSIIDRRGGRERRHALRPRGDRRPLQEERVPVPARFRNGWLCFQHGTEWHRVAPIPPSWQTLPERELLQLMRADDAGERVPR